MDNTLPQEAVDEISREEKDTILKPNPDLVTFMSVLVQSTLEQFPQESMREVVYHIVKSTLRNPKIRPTLTSIIPAMFVYYIEVYKTTALSYDSSLMEGEVRSVAALDIFELYQLYPNEHTVRQLLKHAVKALHEVVVAILSQNENLKFEDMMGRLSNVALLSETIKTYISRAKCGKNIDYIAWLKTFFERAMSSDDLSFMDDDFILKKVIPQITHCKPVIDVKPL